MLGPLCYHCEGLGDFLFAQFIQNKAIIFQRELKLKTGTSAQGWCTGMTQRDGMGREVGGGSRMGNTCKSMADSCKCIAKTTIIL